MLIACAEVTLRALNLRGACDRACARAIARARPGPHAARGRERTREDSGVQPEMVASGRPPTALAVSALLLGLGEFVTAAPSSAVEREIASLEPELSALLQLSVNGAERGAAYNRTADFCDLWGHRISGSENLENSIDSLAPMLRAEGLSNVHYEPAMVPHWVCPLAQFASLCASPAYCSRSRERCCRSEGRSA